MHLVVVSVVPSSLLVDLEHLGCTAVELQGLQRPHFVEVHRGWFQHDLAVAEISGLVALSLLSQGHILIRSTIILGYAQSKSLPSQGK